MDKRLVRIIHYGASGAEDVGIDRDPTAYVVLEHDSDTLAVELGNVAAYWTKVAKGFKRGGFPRRSIQTFISYRKYHHAENYIKPLDAFVSHPTLRADGTLLTTLGYDSASRLFLTAEIDGLKINDKMKRADARDALVKLMQPFSEYPWASGADRAVFCAALFTVGLRHLFNVAPLFAFSSPKHGSGKTQLAECISRLWYGITLSKATWTPNPEEMEKRIAAFLLAGDRIVCLDNVTEGLRLEDSTLNKVLTSRRNTFRILGRTERLELTNQATWFATGNQLNLSGDISRRALMCYVDARMVDPSARSFRIPNLPLYITEHRAELLGLALSIVASWFKAGKPEDARGREYGSFNDWYALIRPMLMWVGEEDIAQALNVAAEEDTDNIALEYFANGLRKAFPPDGTRLATMDILKLISTNTAGLRSSFEGIMSSSDREPNVRTLSHALRRCENKVFVSDNPGGMFTINRKKDTEHNVWIWGIDYHGHA